MTAVAPQTFRNAEAGGPAWPLATVIVPTYNRAALLRDTLVSLLAQDYPADAFEIIVVDNSSQDNTEDVVRSLQATAPVPLHFYRKENRGPAASRNLAIARSKAATAVFAFTDSDCLVPPDWLRRGVALMQSGVGLVAGPILARNNPDRIPGFFAHQIDHRREDYVYATANIFYRADIVRGLGGFNERYGTYPWGMPVGGEDTDLAWRVKRGGYTSVFDPDLSVSHHASDLPPVAWLIEPARSMILPRLVRQFPELRRGLWNRYFVSRDQAFFYPLLAGVYLALCRRSPSPLLMTAPWLWEMHSMVNRDAGSIRRWWRIPVKYGLTAERQMVRTLGLWYSSIRNRTPVL